jgi:D-alanine-D-alanine ligase-like ATP-grasp enzyme
MAPKDWALNVLPLKVKAVMTHLLKSIDGKLDTRMGIFDFLGLDFLIDDQLNVWFIETNVNPALHRNSTVLDERITKAVTTALDIVFEVHEKQRAKQPVLPFECETGEWEVLIGPQETSD